MFILTAKLRCSQVRFPKLRQILFKVAWESHRRQILAALPILVKLVKDSVTRFERELYGSSLRCEQLRIVISETISDIGLIASESVEASLLKIAADKDIRVQIVAARAMALWRNSEKREFILENNPSLKIDQALFDTLQYWQNETRVLSLVDSILKERDHEKSQKPEDYIRATIALTVGAAALYDPSDHLSPKLYELVRQLINERNQFVRNRVFSVTLPEVIQRHLLQLRQLLHEQLSEIDLPSSLKRSNATKSNWALPFVAIEQKCQLDTPLIFAVARSLAAAFRSRPNDVIETLNLWSKECKNKRPARINRYDVTSREALLVTVALTYGEIKSDEQPKILSIQQIFERLQNILTEELHPSVRYFVFFAIGRQAYQNFQQIELNLQNLVTKISTEERHKIAEILAEIYLDQRAKLPNGERLVEVNGREYPIWFSSPRPELTGSSGFEGINV